MMLVSDRRTAIDSYSTVRPTVRLSILYSDCTVRAVRHGFVRFSK